MKNLNKQTKSDLIYILAKLENPTANPFALASVQRGIEMCGYKKVELVNKIEKLS